MLNRAGSSLPEADERCTKVQGIDLLCLRETSWVHVSLYSHGAANPIQLISHLLPQDHPLRYSVPERIRLPLNSPPSALLCQLDGPNWPALPVAYPAFPPEYPPDLGAFSDTQLLCTVFFSGQNKRVEWLGDVLVEVAIAGSIHRHVPDLNKRIADDVFDLLCSGNHLGHLALLYGLQLYCPTQEQKAAAASQAQLEWAMYSRRSWGLLLLSSVRHFFPQKFAYATPPSSIPLARLFPSSSLPSLSASLFAVVLMDRLPLTALLITLAPGIHLVRRALEIPAWTSTYDAFLLIAVWWAAVLLAEPTLRYFLPLGCIAPLAFSAWSARARPSPPLASEHTLQAAVADLTVIESLVPAFPALPAGLAAPKLLLRSSLVLYVPYLLLTHFVRLRVLVAIGGTGMLAWRAPWAIALRNSLWRSAWFRWAVYRLYAAITGQPLPLASQSALSAAAVAAPTPTKSLRFLFTVYENQRWWMGLDWTAALLPAERPSWCSKSQNAVAPPNAFVLPDDTTLYIPSPDGKGRAKRCARWTWEEHEWRVIVRKEGATGLSRVEKPLPSEKEENPGLLMKAAVKMRESSGQPTPQPPADESEDKVAPDSEEEEEELVTDEDGWVYGDNKWEKPSAKGGMGKYTRFRRWTRVALVTETIEPVPEGEVEITPQIRSASPVSTVEEKPPRDGSPLKQRLKSAMHKATL
ncbi:integral peroxisomal membrane peroxin-domain-containing protein [Mycena epipterygia]|nr:integral peroxisomal membrane peroxin-domain-containing protein [Mycena epipterygia]